MNVCKTGALFNVPHNVEVLMEVGPELGGNEQAQQNVNNGNNNNGNPGKAKENDN